MRTIVAVRISVTVTVTVTVSVVVIEAEGMIAVVVEVREINFLKKAIYVCNGILFGQTQ